MANLYESINESLSKSKAEVLCDKLKEKYDIETLKDAIELTLQNDPSAVEATENKRQPVHSGPYISLLKVCRELLPNVDSKSVKKAVALFGIDYKELLKDAIEYVKEARAEEVQEGEDNLPTPEEEEFFEKNETLVWGEYYARTKTDAKDGNDIDYDILVGIVRDLMNKNESEELDESRDRVAENLPKFIYVLCSEKGNAWSANGPSKTLGGKVLYKLDKNGPSEISNDEIIEAVLKEFPELELFQGYRHDGDLITFVRKETELTDADERTYKNPEEAEYYRNKELYAQSGLARHKEAMEKAKKECAEKGIELHEDTIEVNDPTPKRNYTITDITVLEPVGDGDVRAIDVQELLTKVDESLSEKYGNDWGHINIVTSRKTLDESSATFELRLKESNYVMNFIVSGANALKEFQVYTTMGKQIYNKRTMNVVPQMESYVEQFLDKSLREEKKNEFEAKLDKNQVKNTIEEYIRVSGNRESAILLDSITHDIQFYKNIKKDLGEDNISVKMHRDQVQSLIHRLVSLLPLNTAESPEQFKKLNIGTIPEIEEILFGEFVNEVDKEVKDLNEAYQIFNIGNMQVVYNSATQEVVYSIDSKEVQDKRIDLTKIPSVEVPYDTDTIIKNYIEKQVGRIAQDGDEEKVGPAEEKPVEQPEKPVEEPVQEPQPEVKEETEKLAEDDLTAEPKEDLETLEQPAESETGSAIFVRKPQTVDQIKNEIEKGLQNNRATYIVAKELKLDATEFTDLCNDLSKVRDYFRDVDVVDSKNYTFNVIEVSGDGSEDVLLIDNAGSAFAKYVAIKNL